MEKNYLGIITTTKDGKNPYTTILNLDIHQAEKLIIINTTILKMQEYCMDWEDLITSLIESVECKDHFKGTISWRDESIGNKWVRENFSIEQVMMIIGFSKHTFVGWTLQSIDVYKIEAKII